MKEIKAKAAQVSDEQYAQAIQGLLDYFDKKSKTALDHREANKWVRMAEKHGQQMAREVADLRRQVKDKLRKGA